MRKLIFCTIIFVGFCCLAASQANAQETFIYSQAVYDDLTNEVVGYSATEVDYYSAYDYSAYVDGELRDQYGLVLDYGYDEEYFLAEVYTFAYAPDPGAYYTEIGYHYVIARYYCEIIEKSPEGCMPCDGCNTDCYYFYNNWWWYDPFGFSFTNPGYYGPWWEVYAYGPYVEVENDEYINLGSTADSESVPTRGNPDHLQIVSDSSRTITCDILERTVTYRIVDVNNHAVGYTSVRESDSGVVDTCDNSVPEYTQTCGLASGTYGDALSAACPEFGDYDCGYDIPNEQHLWCSSNGLVPLAKLDYNVHHDRIIVSGYSSRLPLKWFVRADGSIQRR